MSAIGQVTGPALPSCVRGCTNLFVRMPRARQRGSMAVTMMLMLVGLVAMLGLVEIGYLYWAKRETQKVVDLAALAGAQQLTACSTDNSSNSAALGNARIDNGFSDTLVITCGHWDPTQAGAQHFVSVTSSLPLNAVRVEATLPVTPFFGFARFDGINATAIAASQGQPIAAFSVGSSLLNIDPSSPLGTLLGTALGSSLGLQLLSYNGIANANISLLGLVKALPVDIGTVNSVLTTQVTVTDLLTAYVNALSQSSSASTIDLAFVNQQVAAIELQLGNIPINLGQILNVDATTEDPNVALNVDVNALDILSAVVLAADGANAVALPATSISIPGVATISLALSIVEPPQIGVGGVGTVAHTAEIRLDLDVTALSTPINGQQLLDLPLYLEVAPTDGTITAIECNVPGSGGANSDSVTITAAPGVLNAFLGKLPSAAFNNTSETWSSLISSGSLAPLVNVLNLATISASANVQLAANPATALTFSVDPTIPVSQQSGMTQTAGTSSAVLGNLIGSLLGSTSLNVTINLLGLPINLAPVASLLATLSAALAPVLSSLDTLLVGPLLQALGINIGTAQVSLLSVNCNTTPQLVY
jgi:uncharacterized membrane protein